MEEEEQRTRLLRLSAKLQLFAEAERQLPRGIAFPEEDAPIVLAALQAGASHPLTGDVGRFGAYFGKKIEGLLVILPGRIAACASVRSDGWFGFPALSPDPCGPTSNTE